METRKRSGKKITSALPARPKRLEIVCSVDELEAFRATAAESGMRVAPWVRNVLRKAAGLTAAALLLGAMGCGASYQRRLAAPVSSADGAIWYILDEPAGQWGRREVPYRCAEREDGSGWVCRVVEEGTRAGASVNE